MAYKYDKDLEFLKSGAFESHELNGFVEILTHDIEDGQPRKTETLTKHELYKKYYPNHKEYIDAILEEFQRFGGNTAMNMIRGGGVTYCEILCDVCDTMKVEYNKKDSIEVIEDALLTKIAQECKDKLDKEQLQAFSNAGIEPTEIKVDDVKQLFGKTKDIFNKFNATPTLNDVVKFVKDNKDKVAPLAAIAGVVAAVTAVAYVAGPAYRVTTPAVIQIIMLRMDYNDKKRKSEEILQKLENDIQDNIPKIESIIKQINTDKDISLSDVCLSLNQTLHILFVGASGVGKSSTINALCEKTQAEVKEGTTLITQGIKSYALDNIMLYDSAGFGIGIQDDENNAKALKELLMQKDEINNPLIDFIIITIDFSVRDLESTYKTIKIITENLDSPIRILFALNKCDAMLNSSDSWDYATNQPSQEFKHYLEMQKDNIKKRIEDNTKLKDISIIYYSAGSMKGKEQSKSYNIAKLQHFVLCNLVNLKLFEYQQHTQRYEQNFKSNGNKYQGINSADTLIKKAKILTNLILKHEEDVIDFMAKNYDSLKSLVTAENKSNNNTSDTPHNNNKNGEKSRNTPQRNTNK